MFSSESRKRSDAKASAFMPDSDPTVAAVNGFELSFSGCIGQDAFSGNKTEWSRSARYSGDTAVGDCPEKGPTIAYPFKLPLPGLCRSLSDAAAELLLGKSKYCQDSSVSLAESWS